MTSPFVFLVLLTALLAAKTYAGYTDAGDRDVGTGFSYRGKLRPSQWGILHQKYATCAKGTKQSPIDIQTKNVVLNKRPETKTRKYIPSETAELIKQNTSLKIKLHNGGVLTVDGKDYTLVYMHFHTPSEHTIDGVRYDGELHLVHEHVNNETHKKCNDTVTAVLYKIGNPEPALTVKLGNERSIEDGLKEIVGKRPSKNQTEPKIQLGQLDPSILVANVHSYYKYEGSFTSPPCSEGVVWRVLTQTRTLSQEQIMALKRPLMKKNKNNYRPVQPLNGRKVELYNDIY